MNSTTRKTVFTKCEGCSCDRERLVAFLIFHSFGQVCGKDIDKCVEN